MRAPRTDNGQRRMPIGAGLFLGLALLGCAKGSPCEVGDRAGCLDAGATPAESPAQAVPNERTPVEADAACAMQSARAERGPAKQVDIVLVVDNSGSMTEEINAIRTNINQNFARLIEQSGVDFRVIVLSLYGATGTSLCVEPPLAGSDCSGGLWATNSDVFFHYNVEVSSNDPLCLLLFTFDHPDPEARAPAGFQEWLRPDAEKVFVVFTDDSAACLYRGGEDRVQFGANDADPFADALLFHETLLELSPEQFGTPPDTRYRFYSIVGLSAQQPASQPWFPDQGLDGKVCETAPSPGLSYQALSIITDALRYPVCEGKGFDAVFRVLARNVIEASKVACVFELPTAPADQAIDRRGIRVEYGSNDGQPPQLLGQLEDGAPCNARSFYIRDERIELCPEACAAVQADLSIEINVLYGCGVVPR